MWTCWCALDHCPAAEHKRASVWGHEQMAGHSSSGFFGRRQNSWICLSRQVFQVLAPDHHTTTLHHRVFSQNSQGSSRCFLAKLRRAFVFLLLSSGFVLGTQSLSYGGVMNSDINWGKWSMQFFGCCSGVFRDLLDELSMHSWSTFGRLAIPVSGFLHVRITAVIVVHWGPKPQLCNPFQTDRCQWLCFSAVSLDCGRIYGSTLCCFLRSYVENYVLCLRYYVAFFPLCVLLPNFIVQATVHWQ